MQEENKNPIKNFTDLKVWQEGHQLAILVYNITKQFPREETYSLIDQMHRAAVSVTSNIAEGFGRHTYKDKVNFFYQAQGSLIELKNQILLSKDVGYLNDVDFTKLMDLADQTHRLLQGLIVKSKSFIVKKI